MMILYLFPVHSSISYLFYIYVYIFFIYYYLSKLKMCFSYDVEVSHCGEEAKDLVNHTERSKVIQGQLRSLKNLSQRRK